MAQASSIQRPAPALGRLARELRQARAAAWAQLAARQREETQDAYDARQW